MRKRTDWRRNTYIRSNKPKRSPPQVDTTHVILALTETSSHRRSCAQTMDGGSVPLRSLSFSSRMSRLNERYSGGMEPVSRLLSSCSEKRPPMRPRPGGRGPGSTWRGMSGGGKGTHSQVRSVRVYH